MKLLRLRSRDTVIKKNNSRRDFGEIWKDELMKYGMNGYIFILYEK